MHYSIAKEHANNNSHIYISGDAASYHLLRILIMFMDTSFPVECMIYGYIFLS